jgi:mRNA-degrading endonuclease YafQ of YafQ-DinJ toxin-antitoxin module
MEVGYKPAFVRQLKRLDPMLRQEVFEKIELFRDPQTHVTLKVHKLKGRLAGRYSFSVNYKDRIVFRYESANEVVLLSVGNHDIYKH